MHRWAVGQACHHTHVEARGKPEGLVFSFHHVGIVTEFRLSDLGQAHLLAEPSPRPHYDT